MIRSGLAAVEVWDVSTNVHVHSCKECDLQQKLAVAMVQEMNSCYTGSELSISFFPEQGSHECMCLQRPVGTQPSKSGCRLPANFGAQISDTNKQV